MVEAKPYVGPDKKYIDQFIRAHISNLNNLIKGKYKSSELRDNLVKTLEGVMVQIPDLEWGPSPEAGA